LSLGEKYVLFVKESKHCQVWVRDSATVGVRYRHTEGLIWGHFREWWYLYVPLDLTLTLIYVIPVQYVHGLRVIPKSVNSTNMPVFQDRWRSEQAKVRQFLMPLGLCSFFPPPAVRNTKTKLTER
jgi:hypothetical protein